MTKGPEDFKSLPEKSFLVEREKITKYLQNRMEDAVNSLKEIRKDVGSGESSLSRDAILSDVGFIKGRAHEIYQGTAEMVEEVIGEKLPQLREELTRKYFDEIMKLSDQVIKEADHLDSMRALKDLSRLEDINRSK